VFGPDVQLQCEHFYRRDLLCLEFRRRYDRERRNHVPQICSAENVLGDAHHCAIGKPVVN
jgi:hypothetical protein